MMLADPAEKWRRSMTVLARVFALAAAAAFVSGPVVAASPEMEAAFVAAYKQAYEAQDGEALKALLHTEGAEPMGLEFYQLMMTSDFGGAITVELRDLTPEDVAKADETMPLPNGANVRLAPKPYKKLIVTIVIDTPQNKSTSTTRFSSPTRATRS
jgi:hypothetical protein